MMVTAVAGAFVPHAVRAASAPRQSAENGEAPPAPAAFTRVCGRCHDSKRIVEGRRSRIQWGEVIQTMVQKGAQGSDEDFDEVADYLVTEFGRVNVNRDSADEIAQVLGLSARDAATIVDYRTAHGKFPDFDGLKQVPNLAFDAVQKRRDAITF